jgi:SAM-dependent methyltransferase
MRSSFRSWSTPCDAIDAGPDDALALERPGWGSPRINVQESAARYVFAATAVPKARVLDVASGSGLGSEFLRRSGARVVVGIEADAAALAGRRRVADASGPSFVRADATQLPLVDGSCDVVISFETIEHVADPSRMLAECRRVLRPGGRLYLSTPNRTVTRWLPSNPFHVREFTTREILTLVGRHFDGVTCHWQRPVVLPVFAFRQIARRALTFLPGGQVFWRLWKRIRPARTRVGTTVWRGERFDDDLLNDPHYHVVPARRMSWHRPMYTVLVARC